MYETILKKHSIDAAIIIDPVNMRYVSGFSGGEGIVYISKHRHVLITDSRYTEAAEAESAFELIEEKAERKRSDILSELLGTDNAFAVGFEDRALTCAEFKKLKENLRRVERWVPLEEDVDAMRLIKTKEELELMQKASEIADKAFEELCAFVQPGMTELDGAAELEYRLKKGGADGVSFDTIFAAGKNSSMPHAVPGEYKLQKGDLVTVDFGCKYKGYCSDTTRTFAIGYVSDKQRDVYEIVLKAHMNALEAVKEGESAARVDAAARDIIKTAGYGDCFGHSTGHGVGLYIHEEPRYSPSSKTILKAGMTGTIEPGIYLPGEFGVRIEDMIVVTKDGCRSFTRLSKELMIL